MNSSISVPIERYLGIDLHKHYLVVGGVNAKQEIVLSPRRVDLDVWPKWAQAQLTPADVVVVEATTNAWDFYDVTSPLVQRVVVANAAKIALIAKTRVKTDQKDVMVLARLLAADLIPEVWVPPLEVRELRSLISHRRGVIAIRTAIKNRLQSLLHRHHLVLPSGDPFAAIHRAWWDTLAVSPTERLHLKHDLATLAQLNTQVAEIDDEVQRVSGVVPWSERVTYLIQLPGIGLITAMTILSAIGDITRFEHAKELVGYAGLGASVHDSGQTHRMGRITKQGPQRTAHGPRRSGLERRRIQWFLEGRVRALGAAPGSDEGHCRHRAQATGRHLARAYRAGRRSARRRPAGHDQTHALVLVPDGCTARRADQSSIHPLPAGPAPAR
jgi:transposase